MTQIVELRKSFKIMPFFALIPWECNNKNAVLSLCMGVYVDGQFTAKFLSRIKSSGARSVLFRILKVSSKAPDVWPDRSMFGCFSSRFLSVKVADIWTKVAYVEYKEMCVSREWI